MDSVSDGESENDIYSDSDGNVDYDSHRNAYIDNGSYNDSDSDDDNSDSIMKLWYGDKKFGKMTMTTCFMIESLDINLQWLSKKELGILLSGTKNIITNE